MVLISNFFFSKQKILLSVISGTSLSDILAQNDLLLCYWVNVKIDSQTKNFLDYILSNIRIYAFFFITELLRNLCLSLYTLKCTPENIWLLMRYHAQPVHLKGNFSVVYQFPLSDNCNFMYFFIVHMYMHLFKQAENSRPVTMHCTRLHIVTHLSCQLRE